MSSSYDAPKVTDLGTLNDITEAANNFGNEDGGVKADPNQFGGSGTFS